MNISSVSSSANAIRSELTILRLAGVAKYATLLTLLVGVGILAMLPKLLPSWLSFVAIGTGLTGVLAYVVHDQERPHRTPGLPRYTTVAAISAAAVVYYLVAWVMALPYAQLGAGFTWLLLTFSYVTTITSEEQRTKMPEKRATWLTGFLGLGIVGLGWLSGNPLAAVAALVVTGFAALPQLIHLSQEAA